MDKGKQIEEMANTYKEARYKANETIGSMNEGAEKWYAKAFYNAGYRKASDVAEEIFSWFEEHAVNLNFITGNVEINFGEYLELKKKYTEDGE